MDIELRLKLQRITKKYLTPNPLQLRTNKSASARKKKPELRNNWPCSTLAIMHGQYREAVWVKRIKERFCLLRLHLALDKGGR